MKRFAGLLVTIAALLSVSQGLAQSSALPEGYVSASEILPLPNFIPGAGSLYTDPANMPVGPWLAYGKDDNLVEVLYMVPLSQMNESQNWDGLSAGVLEQLGVSVNHVDITYNGGTPAWPNPTTMFAWCS